MMMPLLLAAIFAFGVLLIFYGIARGISSPSRVDAVVRQYARPVTLEEMELAQPFLQRALWPLLRRLANLLTRFTPQQVVEATRHKLDLAGHPFDLGVVEFLGLRAFAAILAALLLAVVFTFFRASPVAVPLLVAVGATLGFYLPLFWLNAKIRERQDDIQYSLPDALDLLTVCVEAGMGLDAAMAQVADKWNNHLSRLLAQALRELRLGRSRADTLRDLANRAEVRDLTNFIAALVQAETHGAPIARTLRIQSDQMRVLRRMRAQERANQIPVKLLFPLIFLIFPPMFIVLMGPAVIRLMNGFGQSP